MSPEDICAICAWRKDCQKKFSISGRDIRCPDFCRDVSSENGEHHKDEKDNDEQKGDS